MELEFISCVEISLDGCMRLTDSESIIISSSVGKLGNAGVTLNSRSSIDGSNIMDESLSRPADGISLI